MILGEMILDENKIRNRKSGGMFGKLIPSFALSKKGGRKERIFDLARIFIGVSIGLSMIGASIWLAWTLVGEAYKLSDVLVKSEAPNASQVEVVYRPVKTSPDEKPTAPALRPPAGARFSK